MASRAVIVDLSKPPPVEEPKALTSQHTVKRDVNKQPLLSSALSERHNHAMFDSQGVTYNSLAPQPTHKETPQHLVDARPSWTAYKPRTSWHRDQRVPSTAGYSTLPSRSKPSADHFASKRHSDSFEPPSTTKDKMLQYHQYEEEDNNKTTSISFSTLALIRASEDIPANLRMTAIRNHKASRPGELSVEKGNHLIALYQKRGLIYVINKNGDCGFIPSNTCFLSSMYQKDETKISIFSHKYRINSSLDEGMRKATIISSHKATTQFELSVQSRESVYLLFSDDQWVYAVSRKKQSGFLPRSLCLIVSKGYTKLHQSTGGGTLRRKSSHQVTTPTVPSSHTQVRRAIHYLKVTHTQLVPTTLEEVTFSELLLRRANKNAPAYLQVSVIQEYQAVLPDEISVNMNQQLRALYREGDRLFVCSKTGQMGLVPDSICHTGLMYHKDTSKHATVCKRYAFDPSSSFKPLEVMIIQQHLAKQSTELTVYRGEFISVLFYDEHWVYGITAGRQAGFVPQYYCHLNFY